MGFISVILTSEKKIIFGWLKALNKLIPEFHLLTSSGLFVTKFSAENLILVSFVIILPIPEISVPCKIKL